MGHEKFVIIENADGSKPVDIYQAAQIAEQWTEKINAQNSLLILDNSREFMRKCSEEECTKTISRDNKLMGPLYITIHLKALMIDEICTGVVKAAVMDIDVCEKAKQNIIVN